MSYRNTHNQMKLPELNNLNSIIANVEDMKEEVNKLQREKRQIRLMAYAKQSKINILISEISTLEEREKNANK